ncbi:hypothetical protein LL963_20300 [Xanthomonas campestris pv. esculenti]|nr:hypothetical protein [Xanthomonas campestris pv. esculenti]
MLKEFPRPLASIVDEIIGTYYFHHKSIETLFYEAGASGDPPEGNVYKKTELWLIREGREDAAKSLLILGKVVEDLMDGDSDRNIPYGEKPKFIKRLTDALARNQLSYGFGGQIYGATSVTAPSKALGEALKEFSVAEIEDKITESDSLLAS